MVTPVVTRIISITLSLCLIVTWSRGKEIDDETKINPRLRLISVAVLMRHADRNPSHTFPDDPHPPDDLTEWPEGNGMLNQRGRERATELGAWIRRRYGNLLGSGSCSVSVMVGSLQRVTDTACLVLRAVTGARDCDPVIDDRMLGDPTKLIGDCPVVDAILQKVSGNPSRMQSVERYYSAIGKATGWSNETMHTADIRHLMQPLQADVDEDKSLPEWATSDMLRLIESMSAAEYCAMFAHPLVAFMYQFAFVTELRDRFVGDEDPDRLQLFVAHGTRVVAVLNSLFHHADYDLLDDHHNIAYSDTLLFELYEDDETGLRFVRSFFVSPAHGYRTVLLSPPSCHQLSFCPVADFFASVAHFRVQDYDHECHKKYGKIDAEKVARCFP